MPMDYGHIELELDATEKNCGSRLPQEMAKNPALPGSNTANPYPNGIHPNLLRHKQRKTFRTIGTESTQVIRRERE